MTQDSKPKMSKLEAAALAVAPIAGYAIFHFAPWWADAIPLVGAAVKTVIDPPGTLKAVKFVGHKLKDAYSTVFSLGKAKFAEIDSKLDQGAKVSVPPPANDHAKSDLTGLSSKPSFGGSAPKATGTTGQAPKAGSGPKTSGTKNTF
jgi:hypothetical protein